MSWVFKAIVQKIISFCPFSYRINFLLQRYFTVGKNLPESFIIDRIKHAQNHIKIYNERLNKPITNIEILEIGTGWYPIVPITFFLCGANNIETSDIRKLYNKVSLNQTIISFLNLFEKNLIYELIPQLQESRINDLKLALIESKVDSKFKLLKIKSTICKSNNYQILTNSKDLIVSNNTIQLLKKQELKAFFLELERIGKQNSVLSLAIDFTDEFSHFDKSISNFNFLRYSNWQWRIISSSLNSPNRMRYPEYQQLFNTNLRVFNEEIIIGELENLKIHEDFCEYLLSDLLVKHCHYGIINQKNV